MSSTSSQGRRKRQKLAGSDAAECSAFDDAVQLLRASKRILVLVGAGISVSSGVPDFRGPKGVFAMVEEMGLLTGGSGGLLFPEDIFDAECFASDPVPFFKVCSRLLLPKEGESLPKPSLSHAFIAELAKAGKVRRVVTQNVDGLELDAGISDALVVHAHGSFGTASCVKCRGKVCKAEVLAGMSGGRVPRCMVEGCGGGA